MTLQQHLKQTFTARSLVRNMLTGAIIGLMLIGFFLYKADAPDPEWPRFWIIRPLLLVPLPEPWVVSSILLWNTGEIKQAGSKPVPICSA